jgi:transcriptional regulator GlxA family with amidase domain
MASAVAPSDQERPFDVLLIAEEARPYRASGGIPGAGFQATPHQTFQTAPHLDIVVVPGGAGTRVEERNGPLLDWLKATAYAAELATSVCTGAFLFAAAGLLNDQVVTTHFRQIERLRSVYPAVTVVEGVRWMDQGHVISSAGVSAGLDMALHVVSRLLGPEAARRTARAMQYTGTWELPTNSSSEQM